MDIRKDADGDPEGENVATMRTARVRVTTELLQPLLGIPDNSILGVLQDDHDKMHRTVSFLVGGDLPDRFEPTEGCRVQMTTIGRLLKGDP